jgi:putative DNA primase/helicase
MIAWSEYPVGSYRITCPACGRSPRDKTAGLTIEPDGRGVLHCFRCSLVETHRGQPHYAIASAARRPVLTLKRTALSEWGSDLWRGSQPLSGVAVEYLTARCCAIPPEDGHLRWHPALKHPTGHVGPALVALITHIHTRKPLSLHRTWITSAGKADVDPEKLLLKGHEIAGGCVRLWPDETVTTALGIAEGIETALSLAWAFRPVWATIDAGHMEQFPILDGIGSLVIAQDQDAAGVKAATTCARRWVAAGREVLVTNQSANDLNDVLREAA